MRKGNAPSRSQGREEKMQAASFFVHCGFIVKALVPSIPQAAAWPWPAVLAVIADMAREVSA
jgi:hypothetical protein